MLTPVEPWDPQSVLTETDSVTIHPQGNIWVDERSLIVVVDGDYALTSDTGEILRVYEGSGPVSPCAKVPGTRTVVFARDDQIVVFDLGTGEQRVVTDLTGRRGQLRAAHTADGEQVWFTWVEERGDLWVMDVEGGG